MRTLAMFALVVVLVLALAVPAFATGAGGTGKTFGEHHAAHAQEYGGFTGSDNPGMHEGFAGWTGE